MERLKQLILCVMICIGTIGSAYGDTTPIPEDKEVSVPESFVCTEDSAFRFLSPALDEFDPDAVTGERQFECGWSDGDLSCCISVRWPLAPYKQGWAVGCCLVCTGWECRGWCGAAWGY